MSHQVRAIAPAPTAVTAFVGATSRGPLNEPDAVGNLSAFEATFGAAALDSPLSQVVAHFYANGGHDAVVVRVAQASGVPGAGEDDSLSGPGLAERHEGIWALDKAEHVNLLCIPPAGPGRNISARTRVAAASYCAFRRAIFIADPLIEWTRASDLRTGANALDSTAWGLDHDANVALYFPAIVVPDPSRTGGTMAAPPCGAVAGVIARTDVQRGIWKAPAGREAQLLGVADLSVRLSDAELAQLNGLAVNLLRDLGGIGPVVWGARTFKGASDVATEWKYLPVRRTALWIEASIDAGIVWVHDQPNAEATWTQVRASIERFLAGLFRQGVFQGRTSRDAFFVKCGRDTMTQDDIDSGRLLVEVGFAPLKPAEFVIIRIGQKTSEADP